jgi:hypothetical protein
MSRITASITALIVLSAGIGAAIAISPHFPEVAGFFRQPPDPFRTGSLKVDMPGNRVPPVSLDSGVLDETLDESADRVALQKFAAATVDRLDLAIERERNIVVAGEQLLRGKRNVFTLGGREHSRAKIVEDIQGRTRKMELLEQLIGAHKSLLCVLASIAASGDSGVENTSQHDAAVRDCVSRVKAAERSLRAHEAELADRTGEAIDWDEPESHSDVRKPN